MGGALATGPVPLSIVAAALLFVSSPWTLDPRNSLSVCSKYHSGALEGGAGRESGSTSGVVATPDPSPRRTALMLDMPVRGRGNPPLPHILARNVREVGDCPGWSPRLSYCQH